MGASRFSSVVQLLLHVHPSPLTAPSDLRLLQLQVTHVNGPVLAHPSPAGSRLCSWWGPCDTRGHQHRPQREQPCGAGTSRASAAGVACSSPLAPPRVLVNRDKASCNPTAQPFAKSCRRRRCSQRPKKGILKMVQHGKKQKTPSPCFFHFQPHLISGHKMRKLSGEAAVSSSPEGSCSSQNSDTTGFATDGYCKKEGENGAIA